MDRVSRFAVSRWNTQLLQECEYHLIFFFPRQINMGHEPDCVKRNSRIREAITLRPFVLMNSHRVSHCCWFLSRKSRLQPATCHQGPGNPLVTTRRVLHRCLGRRNFIFSSASHVNAWKRKHMCQEIPEALMKTGCYFLLLSKFDI